MKKEDLNKIRKYLELGAEIKCQDILKVDANINSEAFELVDIKHRDYICRVYNLSDIYEILQEFPELYTELYEYWIRALYSRFEVKFNNLNKLQKDYYDLRDKKTNKKAKFMHELVGGNFVCININCTPKYVKKEDLIYTRKEIF